MLIRRVIDDQVEDGLHAPLMAAVNLFKKESAMLRGLVDVRIVGDVVLQVGLRNVCTWGRNSQWLRRPRLFRNCGARGSVLEKDAGTPLQATHARWTSV